MTKREIKKIDNKEELTEKCLQYWTGFFCIGEVLVDVDKKHCSAEDGIEKIKQYLYKYYD